MGTRKSYYELSRKQLWKRLQKKNLPQPVMLMIVERAQAKREALIRAKRVKLNRLPAWEAVIAPLLLEMKRVMVRLSKAKKVSETIKGSDEKAQAKRRINAERVEFYEAYYALLTKTRAKLRLAQQLGNETPQSTGRLTWAEWIPERIRTTFNDAHRRLHTNHRARQPAPLFSPVDLTQKVEKKRERITAEWVEEYRITESALDQHERNGHADSAAYEREKLRLMDLAFTRIRRMTSLKQMPPLWLEYITPQESAHLQRLSEGLFVKE